MLTWTKLKLFRASNSCQHNSCFSFGLNVYSSSKHTNCNYLRAQTNKLSMPFQIWTPEIAPEIMSCGALTLSTRTTFLDCVSVSGVHQNRYHQPGAQAKRSPRPPQSSRMKQTARFAQESHEITRSFHGIRSGKLSKATFAPPGQIRAQYYL